MPPENDERAGIPDQSENRREQWDAAGRHPCTTSRAAPDHHREHPIERDARGESDEMDQCDEICSVHEWGAAGIVGVVPECIPPRNYRNPNCANGTREPTSGCERPTSG